MRSFRPPRLIPVLAVLLPLLAGCLGNSGSPGPVPSGVATTPGDGMFTVSWTENFGYSYWMFLSQDPTLNSINWNNLSDGRALQNVNPPWTVCNQAIYSVHGISYSMLNGGPATFVTLNAHSGSAPGGPGSPLVAGQARASGFLWSPSAPVSAAVNGVGYASITPCGAGGRPPWGRFVAVGPGSGLFFSEWQPLVAGQPAQPIASLSWARVAPPPGFSGSLNSVATRVTGFTPLRVAVIRYAAVGDAGAILASNDGAGLVWSVEGEGVASSNLHAVAAGGSGLFTAVGDAGTILGTGDGVTWKQQGLGVTQANLRAVRCAGTACVAAGDGGTLLVTGNGGASWVQAITPGSNNWRVVAYGNANGNADYASVGTGAYAINTWVVGDDQGNVAFSNNGGATWTPVNLPGAAAIVGIEYASRFLAVDALGNAYASEDGRYWTASTPTGLISPISLVGTGSGYLVLDNVGSTAIAF
jgi:photosystem II stability/assembly factor-like uncharacterized protein